MTQGFLTVEQIGEKQSITPEGFLLCVDVPIARTGMQLYGPGETPVKPGPNGFVKIYREEADVFRDEFLQSLNGKPVTNDHPSDFVTPSNWQELAVGIVLNPRRGEGVQQDLLLADFLLTDEDAIRDVQAGKREVSCGYGADYEDLGPGEARQFNLVANHVALVDSGRCGSRCAIGDSKPEITGTKEMKKQTWLDKIRAAFKDNDEEQLEAALKEKDATKDEGEAPEAEGEHTHIHVHAGEQGRKMTDEDIENRFKTLEEGHKAIMDSHLAMGNTLDEMKELIGGNGNDPRKEMDSDEEVENKEAKEKETDDEDEDPAVSESEGEAEMGESDKDMVKDRVALANSFQETLSLAEVLAPGVRLPAFDARANTKSTIDTMCKLRRAALDQAYKAEDTKQVIDELNGRALSLDTMKCGAIATLFRAAAIAQKNAVQRQAAHDWQSATSAGLGVKTGPKTAAALNEFYNQYYNQQ